jgi:hypothetical protein
MCATIIFVLFSELCFERPFFRFGGGQPLHRVQSLMSGSPVEDLTIRFSISSPMVFLKILSGVLSFLRHSCCIVPWSFIPLWHSSPFHHLFSTVSPLWPCPLCHAGTAQQVICLQQTANFFHYPPSSWVHFFSCQRHPMARWHSPYWPTSALILSTASSSLGTSWCSATASNFSQLASNFCTQTSIISWHVVIFLAMHPYWLPAFPDGCSSWPAAMSPFNMMIQLLPAVSNQTMWSIQSHFWHQLSRDKSDYRQGFGLMVVSVRLW